MKKIFSLATIVLTLFGSLFSNFIFAYQADKDVGFDVGIASWFNAIVNSIAIQNDGKIIVGWDFTQYWGSFVNRIVRLNTDWSIDSSFNAWSWINATVVGLAIQNDGKIIVAWWSTYGITRLNADWSVDSSFNVSNGFNYATTTVALQSDGKILVGGHFTTYKWSQNNYIVRLNADWSKDTSFTIWSGFNAYTKNITVQSDGKILVVGNFTSYNWSSNNYIVRLNADWSKDSSFTIWSGFNYSPNVSAIQSDGKILIGGWFSTYSWVSSTRIVRLNSDWTKDTSFTTSSNWAINAIALQSDGKIILGWSYPNRISRLNTNWSVDSSFNVWSGFDGSPYALAIQNDGKIIAGGTFISYNGVSVVRIIWLNSDWSKDTSFIVPGNGFNSDITEWIIQNDGKILVGGSFTFYNWSNNNGIARLNTDWTKDTSFTIWNGFNYAVVNALNIQDDGKILVGGGFSTYNWSQNNYIVRLNNDWSKDTSFNIGSAFNNSVVDLAIQDDGKILVGGAFTTYSWTSANRIIRLNTDWTRDTSFSWSADSAVQAIAIQDDGKILIGGSFTTYNGISKNYIVRLNNDWSIDSSFNILNGFNFWVRKITIQNDGKILVGGSFTTYKWSSNNGIARLNTDWSKDTSFNIGSAFVGGSVGVISLQSDGKILVGGSFSSYNWFPLRNIVRLNADWSRDTSFDINYAFSNGNINFILIENAWRIYVGGSFTEYKWVPIWYLVALKWDTPVPLWISTDENTIKDRFTYRWYVSSWNEFSWSTRISLQETDGLIPVTLNLNNKDNKLSLPKNIQFKKIDNITNYSGEIIPPTPVTIDTVDDKQVISAVKVGSTKESIKLAWGVATLSIPVAGNTEGTAVSIYSSQDWSTWTKEWITTVAMINSEPYASFTTNHFTYFAIAAETGTFFINNDSSSTESKNVTLTVAAPWATHMRFSNTSGSDRSTWEPIATTKSWTLSNWVWTKTVYAEFDTNSDGIADASTFDFIDYIDNSSANGNIILTITWWVTECVYGTSMNMNAQDVQIGIPYTFTWTFPSTWYCQDYDGIVWGWALTIQTTDLYSENNNVISGSNLLISHDPVVIEGDSACTWYNGTATQFYSNPYPVFTKTLGTNKICRVSASNVSLLVNVPANQAPGNYSGTLTIYVPNF